MKKSNGARPRIQRNDLDAITTGYIMIPVEIDRDGYIETCFRTNRVCVLVEGGLFKIDAYITNEAIQNISFPEDAGEKGTQVIIAAGAFRNEPIVIGTIPGNDETFDWSEETIRFRKQVEDVSMMMLIDPLNREWNLNLTSFKKPANFNITIGGNSENKIKLQSSGEVEVNASKKIKVVSYDTIEANVIDAQVEAQNPGQEVRKITFDKDKFEIIRKSKEDLNSLITMDNQNINIVFNKDHITINDQQIVLSFKDDQEKIRFAENLIEIITGQKVNINGASEPLALANTLIQLLGNLNTQITTLKNAWNTALASAGAMDGGRAGFTAAVASVTGITPVNFEPIKSKVIFSD